MGCPNEAFERRTGQYASLEFAKGGNAILIPADSQNVVDIDEAIAAAKLEGKFGTPGCPRPPDADENSCLTPFTDGAMLLRCVASRTETIQSLDRLPFR